MQVEEFNYCSNLARTDYISYWSSYSDRTELEWIIEIAFWPVMQFSMTKHEAMSKNICQKFSVLLSIYFILYLK